VAVVGSLWIEKGLGMVITGFVPNPFGHVVEYWPTGPETLIALGIYALGGIVLTVLFKIAIGVREELGAGEVRQEPHAESRKELKVA
jgi:molybdopterin-containing oxidoreductase family membrane subunit